jgi:pimeloyl-ACP methyl ester carboxylesterase
VLLVHGFGTDHALTWGQSGWLNALDAAGRTWIAVDLPGHGSAPAPTDPAAYELGVLAAQLGAVAVAEAQVDLVGFSLGGELALRVAAAHPEHVRRLVAGGVGTRAELPEELAAMPALREGLARGRGPIPVTYPGPALLFAGTEDLIAEGLADLAAAMPDARFVAVDGRHHRSTLSASRLKRAAMEFLA